MMIPRGAWKASLPGVVVVAVASVVVFTSGCSMTNLTSVDRISPTGAAVQGKVHGGQFPVGGSTIGLWVAGSTGYGSAGTNLLTSTVTTQADGSFSITGDYTCPTPSSLAYITASGGDPGVGSNNSAIMLVAPLGACGSLTSGTFITINEVTTAAAAIALGQFFTPTFGSSSTDSFGASSTNSVGLTNAFATANNLVNVASGTAVTSATLNGTGTGTGLSVTATPEAAKLNTIANILAACVNSDGSGTSPCQTTLFPSVAPTSGTAPTDTLQAAVYMSLNPTSTNANASAVNMAALFGLQTGTAPFVGLGAQPVDWTVGIQYAGASASTVLSNPLALAADASGNIWVVNNSGDTNDSLSELSPTGTPMLTALNGATQPALGTATSGNPSNIAIDTLGNVWIPTSSNLGYVYEYDNSGSPGTISFQAFGGSPWGIAIDGNNNVFIGEQSSSAGSSFLEFVGGTLGSAWEVAYPAAATPIQAEYMAFDTSGNLWATSGSVSTSNNTIMQLSGIDTSSCGAVPFSSVCTVTSSATQNTYTPFSSGTTLAEPWSPVAGTGGVWVANPAGENVTFLSTSGSVINNATDFGSSGSVNAPQFMAVDGAGNVWEANNGEGSVAEFSSAGAILSPGTGFAHSGISAGEGITLDPSGNIWVADNTTSGADAYSVFEIVGAAAPTVTPIALALKNNAVGQKP